MSGEWPRGDRRWCAQCAMVWARPGRRVPDRDVHVAPGSRAMSAREANGRSHISTRGEPIRAPAVNGDRRRAATFASPAPRGARSRLGRGAAAGGEKILDRTHTHVLGRRSRVAGPGGTVCSRPRGGVCCFGGVRGFAYRILRRAAAVTANRGIFFQIKICLGPSILMSQESRVRSFHVDVRRGWAPPGSRVARSARAALVHVRPRLRSGASGCDVRFVGWTPLDIHRLLHHVIPVCILPRRRRDRRDAPRGVLIPISGSAAPDARLAFALGLQRAVINDEAVVV